MAFRYYFDQVNLTLFIDASADPTSNPRNLDRP